MKPVIIVMSHGNMAKETKNSAEMIVGDTEGIYTVSMKEDDGISGTTEKLQAILSEIDDENDILILTDLKGGTPCNVAMMQMGEKPNIKVLSGLNLAMLLEAIMSPCSSSYELMQHIVKTGKGAVEEISYNGFDEDDELEEA